MRAMQTKLRTIGIWAVGAAVILLAAGISPNLRAQDSPGHGGGFGRAHFLGAEPFMSHKVVTGAPYSAQAVTQHTQTLPDGNTIHTTKTATVYRDMQGRIRREQEVGAIGPVAAQGTPWEMVFISDPVAGFVYSLNPKTQVARQIPFHAHNGAWQGKANAQQRPANPNVKNEALATQVIGGVTAQGTRITRTIPAGQMGNEAAISVVVERWYSPELQTVVMWKQSDPRFGETTFQLTNITRAAPAESLFQVPSDYTIQSGRPSGEAGTMTSPNAQ